MPIQTQWENGQKQVIICNYKGRWSLDEFYTTFNLCAELMDSVDYPVNIIFDMQKSISLPDGFMAAIRSVSRKPHPNLGIMAIVGANKLVQIFTDVIRKVYKGKNPRTMYMVSTREEAHKVFAEMAKEPLA
jgi:hypothetical protein